MRDAQYLEDILTVTCEQPEHPEHPETTQCRAVRPKSQNINESPIRSEQIGPLATRRGLADDRISRPYQIVGEAVQVIRSETILCCQIQ
jgi:hypothetical protein